MLTAGMRRQRTCGTSTGGRCRARAGRRQQTAPQKAAQQTSASSSERCLGHLHVGSVPTLQAADVYSAGLSCAASVLQVRLITTQGPLRGRRGVHALRRIRVWRMRRQLRSSNAAHPLNCLRCCVCATGNAPACLLVSVLWVAHMSVCYRLAATSVLCVYELRVLWCVMPALGPGCQSSCGFGDQTMWSSCVVFCGGACMCRAYGVAALHAPAAASLLPAVATWFRPASTAACAHVLKVRSVC